MKNTIKPGFYRSALRFFMFVLTLVTSMLSMASIFRLLAAASPSMDVAHSVGACVSCVRACVCVCVCVCVRVFRARVIDPAVFMAGSA